MISKMFLLKFPLLSQVSFLLAYRKKLSIRIAFEFVNLVGTVILGRKLFVVMIS